MTPTTHPRLHAAAFAANATLVLFAAISLWGLPFATAGMLLAVAGVSAAYLGGDRFLLRRLGAYRPAPGSCPALERALADAVATAGVTPPVLHVVDSESVNAFVVGRDAENVALGVTKGLLARLDGTALQAVLAHELGHVRNGDVALQTVRAALCAPLLAARRLSVRLALPPSADPGDARVVAVLRRMLAASSGATLLTLLALTTAADVALAASAAPSLTWLLSPSPMRVGMWAVLLLGITGVVAVTASYSRACDAAADADAVWMLEDADTLALAIEALGNEPSRRAAEIPGHLFFADPRRGGRLAGYDSAPLRAARVRALERR